METSRRQLQRLSVVLILVSGWTCTNPTIASSQHSAQRLTISGTVIDNEGRPLAGATVSLAPVMDDYEGYELRLGEGLWAKPVVTVETPTDGRYALSAASGTRWRLIVEHPGRVTVTRRLEPLFEDRELSAAKLRLARPLEVRVKTADGIAVAGARVMAHSISTNNNKRSGSWPDSWVAGATDATGRARLTIPRIGPWQIEVAADGQAPVRVEHGGGATANIELVSESRLDLRLRLASGKPAAAALVFRPSYGLTLAKADADGRVTLLGLPGSRQKLRVLTADGAALETELEFQAGEKRAAPITLELRPPNHLDVQVVEAETLDPVAGAVAWGRDDHVAFGDAQGRLTLTLPGTETSISLGLAAPHYIPWKQNRLPVSMAGEQTMTVVLERVASLRGKVIDSDGRPLAGVSVGVMPEVDPVDSKRFALFSEGREALSGADGRFEITSLPPATRLGLIARKAGFATTHSDLDALPPYPTQTDLAVVLAAGRTAIGTVVDEAMHPVAGASVELFRWRRASGNSRRDRPFATSFVETPVVTDAAGQFALRDMAAGRFDLRVSAAGFVMAEVLGMEISDGTGPIDLDTVSLQPGMRLAGQVVDEDDRPVAGADVWIGKPGNQSVSSTEDGSRTLSDSLGRFHFVDRATGSYQIRARLEGFLVAESGRLETPLEAPIVLVLRRGATLVGRVVDDRGDVIVGARIRTYQFGEAYRSVRTTSDEAGHFELAGLATAKHQLTFEARGFHAQKRQIQVLPNTDLEPLEMVLERGARVSGQVEWPDGRPVSGVFVEVTPVADGDSKAASDHTNASGQFEIDNAPIGPAVVTAWVGSLEIREEIEVRLGRQSVSLTLPPGFEVSGRVSDEDGEPVASARVTLRPSMRGGRGPRDLSDDDGSFSLTDVVRGTYQLRVQHPRYAAYQAETRFDVEAGPTHGLEARLSRGAAVSGRLDGLDPETFSDIKVSLEGRGISLSVTPDHTGRFRFEHLLPNEYRAKAKLARRVLAAAKFELPAGHEELEIELLPLTGIDLRGRVLQDGRGVANARVSVDSTVGRSGASHTTADGIFLLQGVSEGPQQLSVSASGHRHEQQVDVREGQELIVELPTGEVSGQVHDAESGEPLAGVTIELRGLEDPGTPTAGKQNRSPYRVTSDSMGVFVLHAVDSGPYRLSAKHKGYGWQMTDLEVGSQLLDGVDLALSPSEGLVLRVSRNDGSDLRVVDIALFDQVGRRVLMTGQSIDADGRAHFVDVPIGAWQLWVRSMDTAWARLNVRIPSEEISVELAEGAMMIFRVPESVEDWQGFVVNLRDAQGQSPPGTRGIETILVLEGKGYVGNLWPGRWTLELSHPDGRIWRAAFTARAGQTSEIELH